MTLVATILLHARPALVFAQAAIEAVGPLAREGLAGFVIGWICLRVEKRLDRMEHTIKGLAMGVLMDLSTRKVLAPTAQKIVDDMLRKMGIDPSQE